MPTTRCRSTTSSPRSRVFSRRIGYESNISENDDGDRRLLTRRRLLVGVGGTVGLAGAGALYVQRSLQGDDGDLTASTDYPRLSTRGVFDEDGAMRSGVDDPAVTRAGAWSSENADALVVYVHGLGASEPEALNQAYTARAALRDADVAHPVVAYTWDSDRDWGPAKRTADANGPALADWLARWADADGRPVHLVGHSLGARVVCETLRSLAAADRGDALATVSLLGGAIPRDSVETDGRYGAAIAATTPHFANYYSGRDDVLGWLYRFSDGTNAVGHSGIGDSSDAPDGYRDVDVSDRVADHYSYYEPGEGCAPELAATLR